MRKQTLWGRIFNNWVGLAHFSEFPKLGLLKMKRVKIVYSKSIKAEDIPEQQTEFTQMKLTWEILLDERGTTLQNPKTVPWEVRVSMVKRQSSKQLSWEPQIHFSFGIITSFSLFWKLT